MPRASSKQRWRVGQGLPDSVPILVWQNYNRVAQMVQFKSCEETLVLLAAVIVAVIAVKLFRATLTTAALVGMLAAAGVAYVTFFEFTLANDRITYRNRFRQIEFPLSHVKSVGMQTFWMGLPGHTIMFALRKPPADTNGYFLRTGLLSWPSANDWVEAVNSAIRGKSN
jgi:hypothetical protein